MHTLNENPHLVSLVSWVLDAGARLSNLHDFWKEFAAEACSRGLPLDRIWYCSIALHPQLRSTAIKWDSQTNQTEFRPLSHERSVGLFQQKNSVIQIIMSQGLVVRQRLAGTGAELIDPILLELQSEGYADYIAFPIGTFESAFPGAITYATRLPGGFSEAQISELQSLVPAIRAVCRGWVEHAKTRGILDVYLGKEPSSRVMNGMVKRGDGDHVQAAVLFADLRGFTQLSNSLSMEDLLALLNDWFEAVVSSVEANGGTVLKFIGDGVLAVVPSSDERSPAASCAAALRVVASLQAAVAKENTVREAAGRVIRFGLGLHFGDVMYGNIGSKERLDFTVIGPAVNIAARLEPLCSTTDSVAVLSEVFAGLCGQEVEPLGEYILKGVPGYQAVFRARI